MTSAQTTPIPRPGSRPGTPSPNPGSGTRYLGAGLVVVFVVSALVLWAAGVLSLPGAAQVSQRQSETTAQLYFDSPAGLPTAYRPGAPLAFTWTLGNQTDSGRGYPFTVTAERGATSTVLERGVLTLAAGQQAAHTSTVALPTGGPTLIVVRIDGMANRIFFHTTERAAAEAGH
ncbi:hypothetical protein MXD59_07845 [Frankia sp. Ag45/Mut15]|uniref:DUF1616 domain-containing protein n=1 Tax=Frankia umida TaxID=573489 RepID=A0ABT0JVW6_9ACTN|nr:hypothetical protein [Frankia umida]MCK9875684.1 hypothetical protein [Frankia umida]